MMPTFSAVVPVEITAMMFDVFECCQRVNEEHAEDDESIGAAVTDIHYLCQRYTREEVVMTLGDLARIKAVNVCDDPAYSPRGRTVYVIRPGVCVLAEE